MNSKFDRTVAAIVTGIVVALLAWLLGGCAPSPRSLAQGYAIRTQAEVEAADAAQSREIAREEQDWANARRTQVMAYWQDIRPAAVGIGWVMVVCVGLALAWSATYASVRTARAYGDFVTIRARLVHADRVTGVRPALLWPETAEKPQGLLAQFGVRHVHGTRWYLVDGMTGEHAVVDERQGVNGSSLEVYRQLLMAYQVAHRQERSGRTSPHGEVAEAIGQARIGLPEAGHALLDAARDVEVS